MQLSVWLWIYIISCLPALSTLVITIVEDVRVARGTLRLHKGPNWQWGHFGFIQLMIVVYLIPVVNTASCIFLLYTYVLDFKRKVNKS